MTERERLTTVYGGLAVLMSACMLVLLYALVRRGLRTSITAAVEVLPVTGGGKPSTVATATATPLAGGSGYATTDARTADTVEAAAQAALKELWATSWIVLAIFAALSIAMAWWLAGRVLRPVATITDAARKLSAENLHERIALRGPSGELRRLADTFDAMAERIERLVSTQQRFAANAAHELRTNLAVQRAAAEIGLADPHPERIELVRRALLESARDCEALIESLLLLATAEQGLQHTEPVHLDAVADQVAAELADEARGQAVGIDLDLEPLTVPGDRVLLEHLVHNLLRNAVRYNVPGGRVRLRVGPAGLTVDNTGPHVAAEHVDELFEPFRRLHPRRRAPGEGAGLGLSIVASIARAHQATVTAHANPDGGLTVHVDLDPSSTRADDTRN